MSAAAIMVSACLAYGFVATARSSDAAVYGAMILGVVVLFNWSVKKLLLEYRNNPPVDAADYQPPVKWEHWRPFSTGDGKPQPAITHLVTNALLQERSRMPRCLIWYRPAELDETKGLPEGQWLSVEDGNENLPAVSPIPEYVQVYDRMPGTRRYLALLTVSPDILANLNRGPLRKTRVSAIIHPSGTKIQITLPMGAAGAPPPRPPAPVSIIHGAGAQGSGDADAEKA